VKHGGNVWDEEGRAGKYLDFSTTVQPSIAPLKLSARSLRHYPQPFSSSLCRQTERLYRLPSETILFGNGTSECIAWIASSLGRHRARLPQPFFGEHLRALQACGASLSEGVSRSHWICNPTTPAGKVWGEDELLGLLKSCREKGTLLVADESLMGQALGNFPTLLNEAVRQPGCLVLRSPLKALGLPGLRLGLVAGHPETLQTLKPFQSPWSLNVLAQSLGLTLLKRELSGRSARSRKAAKRKQDLLRRLAVSRWRPLPSDTGYFLVRGKNASETAVKLKRRHILVRSCEDFGFSDCLRLNPGTPFENARLTRALELA
jgi:histidinol-phosphate/aromatic aminotransferase/cobyric acid decarboxylase-like protein